MTYSTKFIALLLASLMLLPSCSPASDSGANQDNQTDKKSSEAVNSSDSVSQSESETLTDNVPAADYEGHTFTFLTRPNDGNGYWGHFGFYAEELTAEPINDAVYERNSKIAERFNIKFAEVCDANWWTMFTNAINASEDIYDCVPMSITSAASCAVNGQLIDFSQLQYIDLSKPWWDPVLNEQSSIANKLYFAIGDMTLLDKEATYIMMFNKDVAHDYNIEDLYELARSGNFTADKFQSICASVSSDLDGDGKFTFNDRVGVVTDTGATYQAMYYSFGAGFFKKDSEDMPYFDIDLDKASAAIDKIVSIVKSQDTMMETTLSKQGVANPWSDDGLNGMFKQGRALFYGISLTVMSKMRDMDSDFGVIPYPKLDENQKDYISFISTGLTDSVCVPITASDPIRTSAIIEALCFESTSTTLPAYYDVTVTNKTMRDEESKEMLEYIFDHRTVDPAQVYNWGTLNDMLTSIKDAESFTSNIAKREKMVNKAMEKTLESFISD